MLKGILGSSRCYTCVLHSADQVRVLSTHNLGLWQVVSNWKAQRFSRTKGTMHELIYVKFMGATCLSEELGHKFEEEKYEL